MSLTLTTEFTDALDLMISGENVLLTGKAGTGKSTLLQYFIEQNEDRDLLVTAPTGVAALNIGGSTIHKAFGFWPGMYPDAIAAGGEYHPRSETVSVLKSLEILVVDEISMVRADLFDMMDAALRKFQDADAPFGGVQLILVGDLLQLPPVLPDHERELFFSRWATPYFFSAQCFPNLNLQSVELETIWRQSDPEFIEVLNQVREGSVSDEVLRVLNSRVAPEFTPGEDWVTLTAFRRTVNKINQECLAQLPGPNFRSVADYNGDTDINSFPGTDELEYAVGARVMTVINDRLERFVNGSFGEIIEAFDDKILVRLDDGPVVTLEKYTWEVKKPKVSDGKLSSETVGTITQFPVILAWAITIHKSQGKTIPKCFINLSGGTHTDGQFYVALSRAVDLQNLRFSRPVEPRNIQVDGSLVRMIRRESSAEADTERYVFISFEGVDFSVSQHIAHVHVMILERGSVVADFGTWINPMSDLGEFGERRNIPVGGLSIAPTLGDFWPLLLRQAAGGLVIGDRLSVLERAVRHQEKGMDVALGIGYDITDLDYKPQGDTPAARSRDMLNAFRRGDIAPSRGRLAPEAEEDTEGAVYIPSWAPTESVTLDPAQATDSDLAWSALSGGPALPQSTWEIQEALELMSSWGISRGGWTDERKNELAHRATRISTTTFDLPDAETVELNLPQLFKPGTRVAFTGSVNLNGQSLRKDDVCREACESRQLEYKTGVSKTRCDVLVAQDVATMSNKAQNAREFGKPIVAAEDFERWYNSGQVYETPPAAEPEPAAQAPSPELSPATETLTVELAQDNDSSSSKNLINPVILKQPEEVFEDGTRVSFRGSIYVDGSLVPHGERLQALCEKLGLAFKQAVTRSRCDVLVTDDVHSTTGKARLANEFSKPLVLASDFDTWASERLAELTSENESPAPIMEPDEEIQDDNVPLDASQKPAEVDDTSIGTSPENIGSVPVAEPVHRPPASKQPESPLVTLFQGRDFAPYVRSHDSLALIGGETAWICNSRDELLNRLAPVSQPPAPQDDKTPGQSAKRMGWSFLAAFVLFWVGGFAGAFVSDALGGIIVAIFFVTLLVAFVFTGQWIKRMMNQTSEKKEPRNLPLEQSIGGPAEQVLPVLLIDQTRISPLQRAIAEQLTGLFGWMRAQDRPLDTPDWHQLSLSTLDAVAHFEASGDDTLVNQSAGRIRQLIEHADFQ